MVNDERWNMFIHIATLGYNCSHALVPICLCDQVHLLNWTNFIIQEVNVVLIFKCLSYRRKCVRGKCVYDGASVSKSLLEYVCVSKVNSIHIYIFTDTITLLFCLSYSLTFIDFERQIKGFYCKSLNIMSYHGK